MSQLVIASLTNKHIESIKRIHAAAFPDRALTLMGNGVLTSYYDILMRHSSFCLRIGVFSDGELVGYLIGGEMNGITRTFLKKNLLRLILHILLHPWIMTKPIIRSRVGMSLKMLRTRKPRSTASSQKQNQRPRIFSVLVIAVDPNAQRQGVGKKLMLCAEQTAIENGYARMHLSVDMDNHQAIRFYESLKWSRYHPDHWQGGMIKPLA